MKISIYILLVCIAGFFLLPSCEKDKEPTIDDHFLNYEIPDVPVTQDYIVGVNYVYKSTYGEARYKALFAKTPVLGEYADIKAQIPGSSAMVLDSHLVWLNKAKVDFLLVTIRSGSGALSSYNSDISYINAILSSPYLGNIKIAFAYDFGGLGLGTSYPTATDKSMLIENKPGAVAKYIDDFKTFMTPFFDLPSYLKIGNKNVVFIKSAYRLFSENNAALTNQLRESLNQIGKEVYLVGQQEKWSPPLRFEHRFKGAVDAIYHDNYLGIATNDLTRLYKFNQVTDQAWQYSKAMFNTWGVEYIPNIGPSRNTNLSGSVQARSPYYNPYFEKDSAFFVDYCNVGKLNSDVSRIILVDSWNDWSMDTQMEPATQYGDRYIKILRDQFKVK